MMKTEKKKFLIAFNEAFAKSDTDFIVQNVTDDIRWDVVGEKAVEGKEAFRMALKQMENPEPLQLSIFNIIIDDNKAVVNGSMKMTGENGQTYGFCDIYHFSRPTDLRISEMTSYAIAVNSR